VFVLAALCIIGGNAPTGDDWATLQRLHGRTEGAWAFAVQPWAHHWHPLFWAGPLLAAPMEATGFAELPMRCLNLGAFLVGLVAVLRIAQLIGLSVPAALLVLAAITFHQATEGVLRQWDSFGQLAGEALARWVMYGLVAAALGGRVSGWKSAALPLLLGATTFVALTGTERVLGTVGGALVLSALLGFAHRLHSAPKSESDAVASGLSGRWPRTWVVGALAVVAASILFLIVRGMMGAELAGTGRYTFAGPLGIARNWGFMLYASATPFSTMTTHDWAVQGRYAGVAAFVIATVAVWAAVAVVLWRAGSEHRRLGAALAVAMVAACFPMVVAAHVSEHYVTAPVLMMGLLLGLAFDGVARLGARSRTLLRVISITMVATHVAAFVFKERAAARTGAADVAAATRLLNDLSGLAPAARVWMEWESAPGGYSCYGRPSPEICAFALAARRGLRWVRERDAAARVISFSSPTTWRIEAP